MTEDLARKSMQQGSRSFALASFFLPSESRDKAYLLYQWCRQCDDQIDEAPNLELARSALLRLERESGAPDWVSEVHQAEFLAGLRMDVEHRQPGSLAELELYCFRVAGVVGLMMCPLLGVQSDRALPHASALGKAMQLTNIARDIQTDARMGRVYLPMDLLAVVDADELAHQPEKALAAVTTLLEQAECWYAEGFAGLEWLPVRTGFAIAVAGLVYRRIGHQLLKAAKADPVGAFRTRTVVPFWQKLLLLPVALGLVLKSRFSRHLREGTSKSASCEAREPPSGLLKG